MHESFLQEPRWAGVRYIKGLLNEAPAKSLHLDNFQEELYSEDTAGLPIKDRIPDYSILPQVAYKYPVHDAYFAYASRGCVRKYSFCGVPKLEGDLYETPFLTAIVQGIEKLYGPKTDLILMDNNIVASPKFKDIIPTNWPPSSSRSTRKPDYLQFIPWQFQKDWPGPGWADRDCDFILISVSVKISYPVQVPNLIAIVGRPNVGKSALFNRIVKKRIAIVHDQPGVTRDRISAEAEWHGRAFTLVDTGGIGLLRREKAGDVIIKAAMEQVDLAVESANVIILVVNVQEGIVPLDREVAQKLRGSGKPILVAVNKVDTHRAEAGADEFAQLGFDKIFPVSAIHGEGIVNLMDAATALLPPGDESRVTSDEGSPATDDGPDSSPATATRHP